MNKNISILLAEDDFLVSEMIVKQFNDLEFLNITITSNGAEAIEKTGQIKPDIIFMDIEMPKMGGIEAATIIQETTPTPIVILTAYVSDTLIQECSVAGVSAYLVKPLNREMIERTLIIALARHNDLMELRKINRKLSDHICEIKTLQSLVTMCAKCRKVRDKDGAWIQLERYIESKLDTHFSHGICEECEVLLYGGAEWYKKRHHKCSTTEHTEHHI